MLPKMNKVPKPLLWQPTLLSPARSRWQAGAKFVISKGLDVPWRWSYTRTQSWIAHLSLTKWYEIETQLRGTNFSVYYCVLYQEKKHTIHVLWTKEICFHGQPEAEVAFQRALDDCTRHYVR